MCRFIQYIVLYASFCAPYIFYLFNVYGHSFPYSRGMQFFCTFVLMMHYGVIGAIMACMILYLYNGTRGFVQGSIAKYGFYAFYPIHILLINLYMKY